MCLNIVGLVIVAFVQVVGVVAAKGANVKGLKIGDRVSKPGHHQPIKPSNQ
jgi:hypothetical protein